MELINKDLLQFLTELRKNNNREWFSERKSTFEEYNREAKAIFEAIAERLKMTDDIASHKLMRIYRDVRFSKDKTPYKARFAGSFKRATEHLRGGYYLNIEPGNTMVGGGFYAPNPADLWRIRKEFEMDTTEIKVIIDNNKFKTYFPKGIEGDEVKTAPRGFSRDSKAIELIRKKQFYAMRSFTDNEVVSPTFIDEVVDTFVTLRPFFNYMSEVLTTNLNGESIIAE